MACGAGTTAGWLTSVAAVLEPAVCSWCQMQELSTQRGATAGVQPSPVLPASRVLAALLSLAAGGRMLLTAGSCKFGAASPAWLSGAGMASPIEVPAGAAMSSGVPAIREADLQVRWAGSVQDCAELSMLAQLMAERITRMPCAFACWCHGSVRHQHRSVPTHATADGRQACSTHTAAELSWVAHAQPQPLPAVEAQSQPAPDPHTQPCP